MTEKRIYSDPREELNLSINETIKLGFDVLENAERFSDNIIINCILSCSMNEIDFDLAQKLCKKFLFCKNPEIQRIAIISASHIVRVYRRELNNEINKKLIEIYRKKETEYWPEVEEVFEDFEIYLGHSKPDFMN